MRHIAAPLIVTLTMSSSAFAQADLVLRSGTILTQVPGQPAAQAVAIEGERIRAVGSDEVIRRFTGPRTRVIDLQGRTVIPGLIDTHVHLLMAQDIIDARSLGRYEATVLPQTLSAFLQHGVTTVRSTGDPWPYIADVRDRLERRAVKGPRLVITGPVLAAPGGHPIPTVCRDNRFCRERAVREVETEAQARQAVRDLTGRRKVDQIKIVVDHGQSPVPSAAVVAAVVDESHRRGRRLIAHASGGAATNDLLAAGVDEFVHMPWAAGFNQTAAAAKLASRRMFVTTTISNFEAYGGPEGAEFFVFGANYTPALRQTLERALNNVRAFADAGVALVLGTDWYDDPLPILDPRARPGARTLHEMELLRRAGSSNAAIISAATHVAAEALGISAQVGSIAAGKVADLVVLDGNPMQDLAALRSPVAVLQRGQVVHGRLPEGMTAPR